MKKIRPLTLTIAALLLVIVMFAGLGLPALFPGLGFSANAGRFPGGAGGNAVAPGQGLNGSAPQGAEPGLAPGGQVPEGRTPGSGRPFGGRQFGGGGANPLGQVGNMNSTAGIVVIGLQVGMNILKVIFAGLGLIAALGLFQMKRWGLVLSVILLVFSLVGFFLPTATLMRLVLPMLGMGGAGAAGNASMFSFNLLRLNWVNLIEPVGLLAVVILGFLPASRKAMAPITDQDLLDDEEDTRPAPAEPAQE